MVSGLGLAWTLLRSQCSGRNHTAVEIWQAQGIPSADGIVTATFASPHTQGFATFLTPSQQVRWKTGSIQRLQTPPRL